MTGLPFEYKEWIGEARKSFRADLVAGITVWALIVPEAVAHSNLALAPTPAAGLYGIIFVLPIYALFASSRYVVATSTAAASATMAGFIGVMASKQDASFTALVLATSLAYLAFYYLRLGFITDFISVPVSRGFMFGLAVFIIVDQAPKVFGFDKIDGNTFTRVIDMAEKLGSANWTTFGFAALSLAIMIVSSRISKQLPGGLIAMVVLIVIFWANGGGDQWDVKMVGALPKGFPSLTWPGIELSDLTTLVPAAIGLVVLGASESGVLAQELAVENDQKLKVNNQFFAFGISNLVAGFFGGHLSTGSTTSTMVDHEAGAKTLISTIWAALGTLLAIFFLTGVFAYVPECFLAVLIMHALSHLLDVRPIWAVRSFSRPEFFLSVTAGVAVMAFGVLNGLLIVMMLNIAFILYQTADTKAVQFGYARRSTETLLPLDADGDGVFDESTDIVKPPDHVLILGSSRGQVYYASARNLFGQVVEQINKHPDATKIVLAIGRTTALDFTSFQALEQIVDTVDKLGRELYITEVHSPRLAKQLKRAHFDPDRVHISAHLDITKL